MVQKLSIALIVIRNLAFFVNLEFGVFLELWELGNPQVTGTYQLSTY